MCPVSKRGTMWAFRRTLKWDMAGTSEASATLNEACLIYNRAGSRGGVVSRGSQGHEVLHQYPDPCFMGTNQCSGGEWWKVRYMVDIGGLCVKADFFFLRQSAIYILTADHLAKLANLNSVCWSYLIPHSGLSLPLLLRLPSTVLLSTVSLAVS